MSDFHSTEGYVPSWRRPDRHTGTLARLSRFTRNALTALCAFCALLVLLPPKGSTYDEPISFQVARGSISAWGIMITLMVLLAASVPMLAARWRVGSILICLGGVAGLIGIVKSDPMSSFHLYVFCYTCAALIAWLWSLAILEDDSILLWSAVGATIGGGACVFSMGLGERIVILSALFGIRTLFWDYILE